MNLKIWISEYEKIAEELGIDPAKDREATALADRLVSGINFSSVEKVVENKIKNKDVIVFGCGPSLEEWVKNARDGDVKKDLSGKVLIAADGATSALLEANLMPDIIVSDLDGNLADILKACDTGTVLVIHIHGDNTNVFKEFLPKVKNKKIIITTQVEPTDNIRNYFGFTDGDRAVFLAKHFGCRKVELIGFDLGDLVGKYSKPEYKKTIKATEKKKKKLEIAGRLISATS